MSTYIIIQARTGSTRLPGKMVLPFYEDKGILEILLERIKSVFPRDFENIVVATTESSGDDRIEAVCRKAGVKCFRGSENDVLGRFIAAAEANAADKIIRVCADNVLLDVNELKRLYEKVENLTSDYISYRNNEGIPSIKTHYGFWAEGTNLKTLKQVASLTNEPLFHEHVTNFIYAHPETFSIDLTPIENIVPGIEKAGPVRLTIDTEDDFKISQQIYYHFLKNSIDITPENLLVYLKENSSLKTRMQKNITLNSK